MVEDTQIRDHGEWDVPPLRAKGQERYAVDTHHLFLTQLHSYLNRSRGGLFTWDGSGAGRGMPAQPAH
jgi:hypothetical protein